MSRLSIVEGSDIEDYYEVFLFFTRSLNSMNEKVELIFVLAVRLLLPYSWVEEILMGKL